MRKVIFLSALLISGSILISGAMISNDNISDFISDFGMILGIGFVIMGFVALMFLDNKK